MSESLMLSVASIVPCTEAEGPGRRFALWFQGCPLRCPGCCNPEMLPFEGGAPMRLDEVVDLLEETHRHEELEGLTLLGGEPMAHAAAGVALAREAHRIGLNVMVFSGYTLEEIREGGDAAELALLAECDILVDGPYRREEPESERRWIGSANQRVHFLTSRADANDPRWRQRNTLEIRLTTEGELSVNGFPARAATGLWRRPERVAQR